MTAELNNAASHCYLQHQIIAGLECFGLPAGPNPLWIKVFWVHAAGIARTQNSQSKWSERLDPRPLIRLSPPCPRSLLHKRPLGCLKCVTELILTWLERFICMLCCAAVVSISICLKVNALFNRLLFIDDEIGAQCTSKPVDLLCTISLSDPCFLLFCTLTLDQINEVSQYFWLFVSFLSNL